MSNYTYPASGTTFGARDSLPPGNSEKIIKGSQFDPEFQAIETAIASKADSEDPAFTGTLSAVNGSFSGNLSASDFITVTSTNEFAVANPGLLLYRNSASPAPLDNLGYISFSGQDSAGSPAGYGSISSILENPTAGSVTGSMEFSISVAGSNTTPLKLDAVTGVVVSTDLIAQQAIELSNAFGSATVEMDSLGIGRLDVTCTNIQISSNGTLALDPGVNSDETVEVRGAVNFEPRSAPSSPSRGDVYYDSSTDKLRCWDGTTWNNLF